MRPRLRVDTTIPKHGYRKWHGERFEDDSKRTWNKHTNTLADDMRVVLSNHDDFANEKTIT